MAEFRDIFAGDMYVIEAYKSNIQKVGKILDR